MRITPRVFVTFMILAHCACSTLSVEYNYDSSVNFSGLKTYDWTSESEMMIGDSRVDWKLLHSQVRSAVDRELSSKGFTRQASGNPDFLIAYYGIVGTKVQEVAIRYRQPQADYRDYDVGTLVLDIMGPDTRKSIWRGSAQTEIDFSASSQEKKDRINETVRRILEKFPPK